MHLNLAAPTVPEYQPANRGIQPLDAFAAASPAATPEQLAAARRLIDRGLSDNSTEFLERMRQRGGE